MAAVISHIDNADNSTAVVAQRLFIVVISVLGLHRTDDLRTSVNQRL